MLMTDLSNVVAPELDTSSFFDKLLTLFDGFGDVGNVISSLLSYLPDWLFVFIVLVIVIQFVSILIKVFLS